VKLIPRHQAGSAGSGNGQMWLHVRRPNLPWRQASLTECGDVLDDRMPLANRDDVLEQVAAAGMQATTAAGICPACLTAACRWPTFAADPVRAVAREYADRNPRFAAELRALGVLAATHREELDTLLAELADVTDVAEARRRRRR